MGIGRMTYRTRIFKLSRVPGIDSKESIPPTYVAWRASTTTLFQLDSQPPICCYKIPELVSDRGNRCSFYSINNVVFNSMYFRFRQEKQSQQEVSVPIGKTRKLGLIQCSLLQRALPFRAPRIPALIGDEQRTQKKLKWLLIYTQIRSSLPIGARCIYSRWYTHLAFFCTFFYISISIFSAISVSPSPSIWQEHGLQYVV